MFKEMYVAAIKLYKKEKRTNQIRYFSPFKSLDRLPLQLLETQTLGPNQ